MILKCIWTGGDITRQLKGTKWGQWELNEIADTCTRAHIYVWGRKKGLEIFISLTFEACIISWCDVLMLFKQVIRASPTGKLNEETNLKSYTFSFCLCFYSLQWLRQTNSYFSSLSFEELFLHFPVEMAKENDCWPTAIFIAICQQFIFFFFKSRRKETYKF